MEQEWYSIKDFAKYAGLHYNTVRRAILSGKLQAVDHGTKYRKFWRIHRSEIQRMAIFDIRKVLKGAEEELEKAKKEYEKRV